MASSRYRSQFFQAFSRQTMRLGDRLAQTWRQAKLTATWGSQILLYPIYALYQGTRVASRSIQQAASRILPQLQAAPVTDPANPPIDEQIDRDAPVDTPIVRSLIALAGLELSNLTALLPAADGSLPKVCEALVPAAATPIVVVDLPRAVEPLSEIAPRLEDGIEPTTVRVRGLASRLSDRRLVLTTIHNQLLDVLTAEQQIQLQQRIVWELASYRRLLRLRSFDRSLPLPADSPHLLPPIRSFQRLMTWMQQSPIAIATNLFGEAAQLAAAPSAPILPSTPQPRSQSAPGTESINQSLFRQSLFRNAVRSPWAWLRERFRPAAEESTLEVGNPAIVISEAATLTATSPPPPQQKSWWKRKRLAADSTSQTPIAALGREVAALPPQAFDRKLTTTDRSTATTRSAAERISNSLDQAAGAIAIETESTAPTAAPTWIETEARLVGYVKHPLEQLLEWLDAGMLWLETKLSNFWRWLSGNPH
ncbi:hypothetical protein H6F67_16130 [Microcoleus sp. FACHB-1515]|uniref:hypothetical protein n=1 Tax=Cyanophyceae TaxID=3028117 RepID=UPI00168336C9|nr:hypothetical protein [Microcoleus sp. FACHB-1515]MBD2091376.1 hypothetical protein [Microcoleus sp. FACHB-1515]